MSPARTAILRTSGSTQSRVQDSMPSYVDRHAARREITEGLSARIAHVSPKYLYDPLGSRLFQAITDLPEYYPTRTERAILARHTVEISRLAGPGVTLIDLGAGNCEKAKSLFGPLRPRQYVAVDISAEFLHGELARLQSAFPEIELLGLGMDYSAKLAFPRAVREEKRLFFYAGSSIGNFMPEDALALLSDIRVNCGADGGLLIGVDLVKSGAVLQAAYDDPLGVTAAFNLNLLNHLNSLISSDFDVRDWRHRALFDRTLSRVEMHLEATRDVAVIWPGGGRRFRRGERIHTENSYKYELPEFRDMLRRAGFGKIRTWTDDQQWFAVCHATA